MPSFDLKKLESCFKQPTISNTFIGLHQALGLLTAVASSPEIIKPSEWMEQLKASPETPLEFQDEQQAKTFSINLMAWWNYCVTLFDQGQQIELPQKMGVTPTGAANKALKDFAKGYLQGYNWLSKVWDSKLPDPNTDEARSLSVLNMILARFINEKGIAKAQPELLAQLPDNAGCLKVLPNLLSAVGMLGKDLSAEEEQPQQASISNKTYIKTEKTPGRNDLCPCGSGKKFKKCCLH
ncbi:UPF0149 family protein [Aliikangiella sp. IMCC44653]